MKRKEAKRLLRNLVIVFGSKLNEEDIDAISKALADMTTLEMLQQSLGGKVE